MGEYDLTYGHESDPEAFLTARSLELCLDGDPSFTTHYYQTLTRIIGAFDAFLALSVHRASSTTFNVRGGRYRFEGTEKTYTPGSAVDPTDNDTTYVWMDSSNAIQSAVDGTGWPSAKHIKLAEMVVDADGVITSITDLRGKAWLDEFLTGVSMAEYSSNGGIPMVFKATLASGNTVQIHNSNAPFKYRTLDAWSVATSADGGTWKLTDGTNDITDTVTVTGTDKTINRAGTIDDAYHEIAAGGSLSVVGDGANADCEVYVLCMRV